MTRRPESSRLRQRLVQMAKRLSYLIDGLAAERGPVVRGAFQLHGTRCGKPNCRCMRGELHPTAVLAVTEKGQRRNVYLRPVDREKVQRLSERYRRFREARAEIVKLSAEVLSLADQLLETLIEPYHPKKRKTTNRQDKQQQKKLKKKR